MTHHPIKLMILPSAPNRALMSSLRLGYINEEFEDLCRAVATWLKNPLACSNEAFPQAVMRTLNTVLLDNVMRYVVDQSHFHFATVVGYNQFVHNCTVRVKYLDDLFHNWSTVREDKEELEEGVSTCLLRWLVNHHDRHHSDFNASLLQLYEQMAIQTPYRYVRTYRYELDPELRPMLIYTDCIDEAVGV